MDLVTTGFQVYLLEGKEEKAVGKKYHVRQSAEELVRMYEKAGKKAVVRDVMQFERDKKVIR